jgi:hypothetical protein
MILQPTHTCFDDALDYLEAIARDASISELMQHRLVHGVCQPQGFHAIAHAWVEVRDEAIAAGLICGKRVFYHAPRREFYREFRPQMMTKYTVLEAVRENRRTNHYGPWEDYYRRMITHGNDIQR